MDWDGLACVDVEEIPLREVILALAVKAYSLLLPLTQWSIALGIFVLLPMALWRPARRLAALGVWVAWIVAGVTTWLLGVVLTFASFGWLWLVVGLLIFGIGVVPMGIIGAFFKLDSGQAAAALFAMSLIAIGLRFASWWLTMKVAASAQEDRLIREAIAEADIENKPSYDDVLICRPPIHVERDDRLGASPLVSADEAAGRVRRHLGGK